MGGNLGTASPAGDTLPILVAIGAEVEIASSTRRRVVPVADFIVGPKKSTLGPGELITAVIVPVAQGPQQFSKIGSRNAMVIAVASFALAYDVAKRSVTTGIGSAGPRPLRAPEAEAFLTGHLEAHDLWTTRDPIDEPTAAKFGALAGEAASPIDDVRGSAQYRRHAVAVMARRTLLWGWDEYRRSRP
jgi:CO/xanthine dehydrogenase FAD-binding subunit